MKTLIYRAVFLYLTEVRETKHMEERLVGRSWEEWDHELSTKADGTRRNYLNSMKRLIEHHDLTTEELYKMHLDNTRSEDPRDAKIVPRMVLNLVRDLVDSGELKSSSARSIADGVSSFFRANMVPFVLNGGLPPLDKEGKERMTRDQIRRSSRRQAAIETSP